VRTAILSRSRKDVPRLRRHAAAGMRAVVLHCASGVSSRHEHATRAGIAARLAALLGHCYAGEYDPRERYALPLYFVPGETLCAEMAAALGIRDERDFFGGAVPHAIVATKAITHPLVSPRACAPRGWSPAFARAVHHAVLAGYSAFSAEDARTAGLRLLGKGPVRLKPCAALGGRGQRVVRDARALDAALDALEREGQVRSGVVLEPDLAAIVTHSVGQVRVGNLVATYHGTQSVTTDNFGAPAYGGSDLTVVRGGYPALLSCGLSPTACEAITRARIYDAAASTCFPGFFASRRNYDVAEGREESGTRCCGVLEQSWRIGGASGAEIAALEAFAADPTLTRAHTATVEVYGESEGPPAGSTVYFRGMDESVGLITKYSVAYPHANS
jgi:hypothetical protein